MKVKRVTVAVLAALVLLAASASSQAVDTRAIDSVRSKGVLSNQDLKVIDVFLAEAVQELVDTRDFTDIARLRTIILSRQGSQGQYARQFSESARKHIGVGLQRALTLEKDRTDKVTLNLLILIDGLSDLRLMDLSVAMLRSKNAVVRYWAVHSLTNPEIIKLLNSGGTASSQGSKIIAERLMEIVNNSRPEMIGLMAQFAAGVKIPQGEQLLLQIASARIKQYAAWKVEYELLDGAILKLMAGKMTSTSLNRSNVGSVFGQLYSCVMQRYIKGKEHLSDIQKHQLASVIVGTEAGCISKLLGTPQTAIKRAIERKDDSALWAEHNGLLGEGSKAGQLPTKLNFTYGTGSGGKKRLAPMALPAPPRATFSK